MKRAHISLIQKAVAATVVAALIITAPGLRCYEALAQVQLFSGGNAGSVAPVGVTGSMTGQHAVDINIDAVPTLDMNAALPAANLPSNVSLPQNAAIDRLDKISVEPSAQARQDRTNFRELIHNPSKVSMPERKISAMPASQARESGAAMMDPILQTQGARSAQSDDAVVAGVSNNVPSALAIPGSVDTVRAQRAVPAPDSNLSIGSSRAVRFVKSVATIGASAGVVWAAQTFGALFFPTIFGIVPLAAMWSASHGLLLAPIALYARYLMSTRDSSRLGGTKVIMDVALGAVLAMTALSLPAFGAAIGILTTGHAASMVVTPAALSSIGHYLAPALALSGLSYLISKNKVIGETNINVLSGAISWAGSLLLISAFPASGIVPPAAALTAGTQALSPIFLAGLLGMGAFAATTTIAFFAGRLENDAESGKPFTVPGGMAGALRFPDMNWVMMGVVFSLLTGFVAGGNGWTNGAFILWNMFKDKTVDDKAPKLLRGKNVFNLGYLAAAGLVGVNALLGHFGVGVLSALAAPLSFYVAAFSVERMAKWSESLLARLMPKGDPAPSSAKPLNYTPEELKEVKAPQFNYWLHTGILLSIMAASGFGFGVMFGMKTFLSNLAIGAAITGVALLASKTLVKATTNWQETTKANNPDVFGAMEELRDLINAKRKAAGKKEVPMPLIGDAHMGVPNAFATGPGPFHAMVGVTDELKEMTLVPASLREGLIRSIKIADNMVRTASSKTEADRAQRVYDVFSMTIAGSIPGIQKDATADAVIKAVEGASDAQLRELGKRLLKGVMAHEFSHVMNRDMLTNTAGGAINTAVSFTTFGVLWAVSKGKFIVGASATIGSLLQYFGIIGPGLLPLAAVVVGGVAATQLARYVWNRFQALKAEQTASRPNLGISRPNIVGPAAPGIEIAKLLGLAKIFAALWGELVENILLMTLSRTREAGADKSGADLTKDAGALALALGLLITWTPKDGQKFDLKRQAELASVAGITTVNPMDQITGTALDSKAEPKAVGPEFNFLFNLFITHPDTIERIVRLYEMATVQRQQKAKEVKSPPRAPPGGKILHISAGNTAPETRGGFFQEASDRVVEAFSVSSDKNRNRAFWWFVIGDAVVYFGANIHSLASMNLVSNYGQNPLRGGIGSAISSGSQAASSLTTGSIADRYAVDRVVSISLILRALSLFSIPVVMKIYPVSSMPFIVLFLAAVMVNSFVRSTGVNAGHVIIADVVGDDLKYANKANAIYGIVNNIAGIAAPLAMGAVISFFVGSFGAVMGYQILYGLAAGAFLIVGAGYRSHLKLERDPVFELRRQFYRQLRPGSEWLDVLKSAFGFDRNQVKDISLGQKDGKTVWFVEVKDRERTAYALPSEYGGYPVVAVEYHSAVNLAWQSPFIKWTLIFSIAESIFFGIVPVILPLYVNPINHLLNPASVASFMQAVQPIPIIGSLFKLLSGQDGLPGLYAAAAELGAALSSVSLIFWGKGRENSSLEQLQRQARWTYYLSGLGALAYWAIFYNSNFGLSLLAVLLSGFLEGFGGIFGATLLLRVLQARYPDKMGRIYSFQTFASLILGALGGIIFGYWFSKVAPWTAMLISGITATVMAITHFIEPSFVLPLKADDAGKEPDKPAGQPQPTLVRPLL